MSNISEWSPLAGNNNEAPPDGAPEGWAPSSVNDTIRENMAATARWYGDHKGDLVSTGSGSAYAVASTGFSIGFFYTQYLDLGSIVFTAHAQSGAAPTLNVDTLGDRPLTFGGGHPIQAGDIAADSIIYAQWNDQEQRFEMINSSSAFPPGTKMLFRQSSAPGGWTKDTTASLDDTALRLVTGSISQRTNQLGFANVFDRFGTDPHTLIFDEMPIHFHDDGSLFVDSHAHGLNVSQGDIGGTNEEDVITGGGTDVSSGSTAPGVSGQTALAGSDGFHNHDMDIRVNYTDVIIATKD